MKRSRMERTRMSVASFCLACALSLLWGVARAAPVFPAKSASKLDALVERGAIPGAVVALIDASGITFRCFGVDAPGGHRKPTPRTLYEIGSVTKVFTSLLLADMVVRGELKLEDPAERWLVPRIRTPRREGRTFTLLDLATHRSGLDNNVPDFWSLSRMTDGQLEERLEGATLLSAPGVTFSYSNFGACVLGRALEGRAGLSFADLLEERVLAPLGLRDTMLTVPQARRTELAQGFDGSGPAEPLDLKAAKPAGGLKASASDLARFLKLEMGLLDSPLRKAMDLSQARTAGRRPVALGWFYTDFQAGPIYRHDGETPGSRAWVYFMPAKGLGLVLLTNGKEPLWGLVDELFLSLRPGEK